MIAPGSWIGILGGGQLGRMAVHAAQMMGYRVCVLDPTRDCPAAQSADDHIVAAYDDPIALDQLAKKVQAVTTEFENVPAESLRRLAAHVPTAPNAEAVAIAQDRRREKAFFLQHGLPMGFYAVIESEQSPLDQAVYPAILKTAALGYDGKGQATVHSTAEALDAWRQFKRVPCVLEQRIDLVMEISVIVARNAAGDVRTLPVQENRHRDGILDMTIVPARIDESVRAQALAFAARIAHALNYVGVLCVEMFVTRTGEILINEIAPRPHNSGHYSIDACEISQFAQQIRALVNAPLGDTHLLSPAVMVNLLGEVWQAREPAWESVLQVPGAHLHLYGKEEARAGRKMGHVTCTAHSLDEALSRAATVKAILGIPA